MIEIMGVSIPTYGDKVFCDDKEYICKGVQVYFGRDNQIRSCRVHVGKGQYITKNLGWGNETDTKTN